MNGNDTIIGQGSFTQGATAIQQIIAVPQGADWVEVYNWSQSGAAGVEPGMATVGNGFHFYWQRPNGNNIMGDGTQGIYEATGGTAGGGFGPIASFFGTTTGTGSLGNDYASTVAARTTAGTGRLPFPRAGVSVPLVNGITAIDASSFNLAAVGSYEVSWSVQSTEIGQWQIELNGTALANTVLVDQNPTSGGHPVSGTFLITTVTPNSVLAIINPTGNSTALTITPADGAETHANSPTLTIAMVGGSGSTGSPVVVGQTASLAFRVYDPSINVPGAATALTGLSAANGAVLTTAATTGISAGTIVRVYGLNGAGQQEMGGIDYSVGYGAITPTTFDLSYLNSTGSAPSTAGFYRIIPYSPLFYPRRRVITNITATLPTVITLSVDHGFTVGQKVRLNLVGGAAIWGNYAALSNYDAVIDSSTSADAYTITAVNVATGAGNNTITIDGPGTVGFGSFLTQWELVLARGYTPAEVIPVGEDTSYAITSLLQQTPQVNGVQINATNTGLLADSTVNTGFLGMILQAGALLPAGSANDVIFWKAGKSSYGGQY